MESAANNSNGPRRDNTTPSCAVCQRRKVKCNRVYPCGPCLKTGLECTFPAPKPRQKRLKRSNSDVAEGSSDPVPVTSPPLPTSTDRTLPSPAETPSTTARLVSDGAGYRYVNNHLWSALPARPSNSQSNSPATIEGSTPRNSVNTPAAHRTGDSTQETSVHPSSDGGHGRSFLFGGGQSLDSITQPSATHIVQLWQIYLENVDPIMKIIHAPTVQLLVLGQIGKPALPANEQALVSSIYLSSAVSMQEESCHAAFSESRTSLIRKFRAATEIALSAAEFIVTTDIIILQALVLYLAALRSEGETQTVWSLCGLAIRIAGTIGLNQDGSSFDLPPFETEMRRRLHWALTHLDARTAELVGQDGDLLVRNHDVRPPSNLNDSELFPSMRRLPEPRQMPTEMLYVQFRATLASHIMAVAGTGGPGATFKKMGSPTVPLQEKLDIIRKLERRFNEEILAGCDPGVPLQLFTINAVQTFLNKLQLVAQGRKASETPSNAVFELSMNIMNLQMELWTDPCLQRWLWHSKSQFQWFGLTCLIRQTRLRAPENITFKAWSLIRKVFDVIIPTLELTPSKSILFDAIQSLWTAGNQEQTNHMVRQWNNSETQSAPPPVAPLPPMPTSAATMGYPGPGFGARPHNGLLPGMGSNPPPAVPPVGHVNVDGTMNFQDPFMDLDFEAIDWAEFDRLTNELCQQ